MATAEKTQRIYARLVGILFLWLIINVVAGAFIFPSIPVGGIFAEIAERIRASEHLIRLGLTSLVIEFLSAVVFAFALYVTLRPVNSLVALLAMIFSRRGP
jgi:voltage-gated potassium channel Kch